MTSEQERLIKAVYVLLRAYVEDLRQTPWHPAMADLVSDYSRRLVAAFPDLFAAGMADVDPLHEQVARLDIDEGLPRLRTSRWRAWRGLLADMLRP